MDRIGVEESEADTTLAAMFLGFSYVAFSAVFLVVRERRLEVTNGS